VPSVIDDEGTWAWHRALVAHESSRAVVLAGASRIQLGISTEVLRAELADTRVSMLAVDGRHPLATLRDLCLDQRFRGRVVCAVTPPAFLPGRIGEQSEHVEAYHRTFGWGHIDPAAAGLVQSNLAIAGLGPSVIRTFRSIVTDHALPSPIYLTTHQDRSRSANYALLDIEDHRARRLQKLVEARRSARRSTDDEFVVGMELAGDWIKQLQARGGAVLFIRLPTTGRHWEIDQADYPRARYWDRIGPLTGAPTLHFEDVPEMRAIDCPDGSHVDQRDKALLTRIFVRELRAIGFFPVE